MCLNAIDEHAWTAERPILVYKILRDNGFFTKLTPFMDFTDIQVSQIVVREDGTIIIRDEDSEWEDKALNFDDIVEIANVLQESYNARV